MFHVIIGLNGEAVLNGSIDAVDAGSPGAVTFHLLRPKGRIALQGASVALAGPRKHSGGHLLSVNVSDSTARRSRYNLVCSDERICAGWVASIKEAIAASAMEEINTALSQALQLQALQEPLPGEPASAPATAAGGTPQRSNSEVSLYSLSGRSDRTSNFEV